MSQNAQYSHMHTTLQKQMSFEAQYNKIIMMRVQGSHGLLSSVFFVSFLLSGCCNDGFLFAADHI